MIELTTSLVMLASAFIPTANAQTDAGGQATSTQATTTVAQVKSDLPLSTVSVEAYVRDYFRDTPILAEIAKCESTFRQFYPDGTIVRGRVNKADIGVMQINTYYHGESAEKLGFDIYSIDGNLGYAKWLYAK